LPDGLFSDQKSLFGNILEDLGMEYVVLFSGHLEYFKTIGHILWAFGNFIAIWYILPRFGTLYKEKSGNPDLDPKQKRA
jgi:hypothetical protein